MANAGPFDARDQYFNIVDSDASSSRDLTSSLTGIDGLPGTKELIDTTVIGSSGRNFTRSLWNGTFTLEGLHDSTAVTGALRVLNNLIDMSTATTFIYGPNTTGTGSIKYSGSCWIRSVTITGRVASAISFRADGQIEGVTTIGNF